MDRKQKDDDQTTDRQQMDNRPDNRLNNRPGNRLDNKPNNRLDNEGTTNGQLMENGQSTKKTEKQKTNDRRTMTDNGQTTKATY